MVNLSYKCYETSEIEEQIFRFALNIYQISREILRWKKLWRSLTQLIG